MDTPKVTRDDSRTASTALPGPTTDLRVAWDAGFRLCRAYGDNHAHFTGEQKERQWRAFLSTLDGAVSVAHAHTCGGGPQDDGECLACGVRDCPHGEPLHYHHDGCPQCDICWCRKDPCVCAIEKPRSPKTTLTAFACGSKRCPKDGGEHDMSTVVRLPDGGTIACAKCGVTAMDLDMMRLP